MKHLEQKLRVTADETWLDKDLKINTYIESKKNEGVKFKI